MNPELIDTFLDLCETRSFNRTAERLGVTQSTVSGRVRALEKLLGRRLFQRSRSGTELTTEGLMFAPHARSLRVAWAEALHAARHAGDSAMTLRIGLQHDDDAGVRRRERRDEIGVERGQRAVETRRSIPREEQLETADVVAELLMV